MDQYKEFCRLRDYRKPGVEAPQYTEAEAFSLATGQPGCDDHSSVGLTYVGVLDHSARHQFEQTRTI
ncbi:hypothetical protein [Janthinobacterium sp. RA13]|uniref:hypothetical protein n=1 Tax=Janthinobacterium sp. RA13 TaxID=1502762 RepID=UPI00055BEBEF|nr:hypothetical protein [Janthinobacterium sp. RA13]